MKGAGQFEKWASGALGTVCLLLLGYLALQLGGGHAVFSRARASAAARPAPSPAEKALDELARYDPEVRLDLLEELQSRPLPQLSRNPFELPATKNSEKVSETTSTAPPAPPPPPPVPIKTIGYSQKGKGEQEAYVSDDDQVYVVHEGETFGKKYKVLKLTPKFVEIEDEETHQTIQLPFPQ